MVEYRVIKSCSCNTRWKPITNIEAMEKPENVNFNYYEIRINQMIYNKVSDLMLSEWDKDMFWSKLTG